MLSYAKLLNAHGYNVGVTGAPPPPRPRPLLPYVVVIPDILPAPHCPIPTATMSSPSSSPPLPLARTRLRRLAH